MEIAFLFVMWQYGIYFILFFIKPMSGCDSKLKNTPKIILFQFYSAAIPLFQIGTFLFTPLYIVIDDTIAINDEKFDEKSKVTE